MSDVTQSIPSDDQHQAVTDRRAELWRSGLRGDPDAWSELLQAHRGLLVRVTMGYGLRPEQRADVIQETWMRLLEHAHQIREPNAVSGWLATTAVRAAIAAARRQRREIPSEIADTPAIEVDPLDRLEGHRRRDLLRKAVAALPQRERRLMDVLLEPDALSYREISVRLDMPVGAIGPVRQRALRRLRAALEPTLIAG
jgi:RNA polymerase sigma factor (sigma-70 family)